MEAGHLVRRWGGRRALDHVLRRADFLPSDSEKVNVTNGLPRDCPVRLDNIKVFSVRTLKNDS